MKLFLVTFEAVATLFIIGLLGFWVIRRRLVPGTVLRFLSPLAIEIALPSLVFVRILRGLRPAEQPDWWLWPLRYVAFVAWAGVLTALCTLCARKDKRREFAVSLFFQNITFFPLVVLTQMFGSDSPRVVDLFLFGILFSPLFFNTYHLFFARERRGVRWGKTLHPVVIASGAAALLCLLGGQDRVPGFLLSSLELLGDMTIPLLMLILGGNVYRDIQKGGQRHLFETVKFVVAKNIVFPLATLALLVVLRPSREVALILFLQSAVPPITSIPIFAEREGRDAAITGRFLVGSFAFSLLSIPLWMSVYGYYFASA